MIEALPTLIDKIRHPFRPKRELKIDERSWSKLVHKKITEANTNRLPPRFIYSDFDGYGYYFTIETRGTRTLIFYNLYLYAEDKSNTSEVTVLDENNEPRYAYEVEAIGDLSKFWAVSDDGEDVDMIGLNYHCFKRAKLFNSRHNKNSWKGRYPDVDGLIKELELTKKQ